MRTASLRDRATDLAIGLLLVVGTACWVGLVAAQLGRFSLVPVASAAAVAAVVAARALRDVGQTDDGGGRRRALDGPVVFLLASLLYLPGYDATLYGSDATVYFATGNHLARTGSLATHEPFLQALSPEVQSIIFPPMERNGVVGAPAARSPAGLVFARPGPTIYSTFSQLPSVWAAIGFAAAGEPGGRTAGPLLAAGAIMAFYLFVRRASGTATAALAAALLATTLPQLLFARLPMGEAGGQFFVWSALLALARYRETGLALAAVAAGLGFGLAGLARPEYILFLPVAVLLLRATSGEGVPRLTAVTAALLFVHALVLIVVVVPSHYPAAIAQATQSSTLYAPPADAFQVVAIALATAALAFVQANAGHARMLEIALLAVWGLAYVLLSDSPALGRAPLWLPSYTGWPVLLLALAGLPLLGRRWWSMPAGRVACALGIVAAFHLVYDLHTSAFPAWAARRLLPVVLPLLCASAAAAAGRLARRRALAVAAAAIALATNLWNARPALAARSADGSAAAVARVADLVPPGMVVLVDPTLQPALLDVPLLLVHGRDAIQQRGVPGGIGEYVYRVYVATRGAPIYVAQPASMPPPTAFGFRFEPAGDVWTPIRRVGDREPTTFAVRVFRALATQ